MGLASRGLRDLDGGTERIVDPAELALVRRQAARVKLKAVGLATLLLAIALAIRF